MAYKSVWIEVLENRASVGGKVGDIRQLAADRAAEFEGLGLVRIVTDPKKQKAKRGKQKAATPAKTAPIPEGDNDDGTDES